jgi:hypothetical protein
MAGIPDIIRFEDEGSVWHAKDATGTCDGWDRIL